MCMNCGNCTLEHGKSLDDAVDEMEQSDIY